VKEQEIRRVEPERALRDVMDGAARWEIRVHEHGLIALVDVMPRLVPEEGTADFAIVQAARVSYGLGTKRKQDDRALIRYLMRHRHTSPFEMVEFKFHCVLPIFVARQWIRHRTANVNEYSGRYSVMPGRFYTPEQVRGQSERNRQSSEGAVDELTARDFYHYLERSIQQYDEYEKLVERGVARELARIGLPLNLYTEWYWKCDLHNILHFLELRLDRAAQEEIRAYAQAMLQLIQPIVPVTCEAFVDYRLESITLSRLELESLRTGRPIQTENKLERLEWEEKRRELERQTE
jgi:thymidylate synthase (FAD)